MCGLQVGAQGGLEWQVQGPRHGQQQEQGQSCGAQVAFRGVTPGKWLPAGGARAGGCQGLRPSLGTLLPGVPHSVAVPAALRCQALHPRLSLHWEVTPSGHMA